MNKEDCITANEKSHPIADLIIEKTMAQLVQRPIFFSI